MCVHHLDRRSLVSEYLAATNNAATSAHSTISKSQSLEIGVVLSQSLATTSANDLLSPSLETSQTTAANNTTTGKGDIKDITRKKSLKGHYDSFFDSF